MLSKTVLQTCRHCGSERIHKNGRANNGAQRAKCLECQRTFIMEPTGPRYGEAFKEQVARATRTVCASGASHARSGFTTKPSCDGWGKKIR